MSIPPAQPTTFAALGVPASLVRSLADRGITEPFPIQAATLRDTFAGRDVLGRGRTGSGKTLAFALPLVARLTDGRSARPGSPRGLVLAPTRELASQIAETVAPLANAAGLTHTVIFGGVGQGKQVSALRAGVDILIACPGRLEDLKSQGHLRLDAVEVTVLDEADHMADLGFLPAVRRILDATPGQGHRMLFSATLDNGVDILVQKYLTNPRTHSVDPPSSAVTTMTHHIFSVADAGAKRAMVEKLASGQSRRLFFTRTKHQARKLARQLTANGIPAVDLHGNLSQGARERNLEAFSSGAVRVLVATDIAARGIHVDDVDLVAHVDPPAEHKAYLHRSGRTARAGSGGTVVTLMLPEQRGDVRQLLRAAKINATPVAPEATLIDELVGPVAAKVDPSCAHAAAARPPAPQAAGSRGGSGRRNSGGRAKAGRSGRQGGGVSRGQSARSQSSRSQSSRGQSNQNQAGRGQSGNGQTSAVSSRSASGSGQPRQSAGSRWRGGSRRATAPGATR